MLDSQNGPGGVVQYGITGLATVKARRRMSVTLTLKTATQLAIAVIIALSYRCVNIPPSPCTTDRTDWPRSILQNKTPKSAALQLPTSNLSYLTRVQPTAVCEWMQLLSSVNLIFRCMYVYTLTESLTIIILQSEAVYLNNS